MGFRYRYVGYGTSFSTASGAVRIRGDLDPSTLFENELAVDVGGICWGHEGVDLPVIDHHFYRKTGQFPSAAAAVLHDAPRIVARFREREGDFWLVSHRDPDFDAFCAMYLVRCLLEETIPAQGWDRFGLGPRGWYQGPAEIDWFQPRTSGLPPERRWPILLAANAACVDNGRRFPCPKNRTLHSILYAAIRRGRDYLEETNGAIEFFREVSRLLADPTKGLNPLYDSVLEHSPEFAPERALLDRELETYRRDLRRSRQAVVFVPKAQVSFREWFPLVQKTPLLRGDRTPEPIHLDPPHQERSPVDGLYLRDPECLLFKEWARLDTENSSMGQGFLFTAIAYSRGRRAARWNQTDYYFALDPERARGRHLYNVWAALQAEEVRSTHNQPHGHEHARKGFEERAASFKAYFSDPWFDGSNYQCTIVATPNQGTTLKPGTADDLSDDHVARIVRRVLEEDALFAEPRILVRDFAVSGPPHHPPARHLPIDQPVKPEEAFPSGGYCFGRVLLFDHVETTNVELARQIGRSLWNALDQSGSEGPTSSILDRHLVHDTDSIGVWGPGGVVVAVKARREKRAEQLEKGLETIAALGRELDDLLRGMNAEGYGLRLMSPLNDASGIPAEGKSLIIVAAVNRVLHFRIFYADGKMIVDTDEKRLTEQAGQIDDLRKQLASLWPPHEPTRSEKDRVITAVTSINDLTISRRLIEKGEDLLQRVVQLRRELAQPRMRLLREFFEVSGLAENVAKIHELNATSLERSMASRMDEHMEEIAEVQSAFHWIEIFLISVYAVELFHILGESFSFAALFVGFALLVVGISAVVFMLYGTRRKGQKGIPLDMQRFFFLMFGCLLLFLTSGGYFFRDADAWTKVADELKGSWTEVSDELKDLKSVLKGFPGLVPPSNGTDEAARAADASVAAKSVAPPPGPTTPGPVRVAPNPVPEEKTAPRPQQSSGAAP